MTSFSKSKITAFITSGLWLNTNMGPYQQLTTTPTPHLGWLSPLESVQDSENLLEFFCTLNPVQLVGFHSATHAVLQVAKY